MLSPTGVKREALVCVASRQIKGANPMGWIVDPKEIDDDT